MNREDIIRMAREAGMRPNMTESLLPELQHFAQLVAAAEREAIVQMIENTPALLEFATNDQGGCLVCGFTPKLAIAAIRARGEK